MAVPNIFGSATSAIPLSQLDQNFATAITLGNTAVYLGNTTTSLGNVTLTNVTISSGNVSVSTATVGAGSNTAPSITTTGDTNTGIFFPAADTIAFSEGGTEAMRLDSAGNMGLGVTPSALASGYKGFEINNVGNALTSTQNVVNLSTNAIRGTSFTYGVTSPASLYQQSSGTHVWYTAPSGTAGNTISFTQAMTLDANGRLGIGSTSPTQLLTIAQASNFPFMHWNDSSNTNIAFAGWHGGGGGGDDFRIGTVVSKVLTLYTNNTERARIDTSGNLLVGTTTTYATNSRVSIAVANGTSHGMTFRPDIAGSYRAVNFNNSTGGANVGYIDCTASATTYSTSSDYRLKENIAPMTGALAKVQTLKPCTYKWKVDGSDGQGFIAHELQEVCPDAVTGEKDGEEMQGVDYGKLTPILTAALQEAIAKIETLEARIAVLEAK